MMDTIKIPINDETFGKLYPYIIDDLITDIRWNGRFLMIEHLTKGYMKTDDVLSNASTVRFNDVDTTFTVDPTTRGKIVSMQYRLDNMKNSIDREIEQKKKMLDSLLVK